jgi:glycine/D-amino acid oxidase-like deaminating enzyme/nitrite reductase/ring-hydroxylating ferredoxin subunit
MTSTTSARRSLWLQSPGGPVYPGLTGTVDADIAVMGGGIAGITTALRLQRSGARVVVLEAARVGSGVTGNTSAKVSALQATTLSTIRSRHGREAAEVYAAASAAAVADVGEFAAREEIDCDLERRPAVTYAADDSELDAVAGELEAASEAGLPVHWRDRDAGVPYPVAGAVWLDDQIGFHPVKYVAGLAEAFVGAGGTVYESSRVLSVDADSPCRLTTAGGTVRAGQVVVATHYPTLDRGLFFARLKAQRSYCVAVQVADAPPRTMAISAGSNSRSIQFAGRTVVVGGEGHPAGASDVTPGRFDALEAFADAHWTVERRLARWSAQDPVAYDHLPMIGPLHPRSTRLWVATGCAKWGLTGGTFAARILADSMLGREHPWASRFTPNRLSLRSAPELAELGVKFSTLIVLDRVLPAQASDVREIPPGEARVIRDGLGKKGVFCDDDGRLHAVSLRCTHLGCLLRFNGAERSWDCPCHGSRFDVDGSVLEGPAVHPLHRRDP